ncbi:hypothetical protein KAW48_03950 [candidate division WOR-3 bacterium]|nr:hypothetical protein [candidate division WOR-3 bacterium]
MWKLYLAISIIPISLYAEDLYLEKIGTFEGRGYCRDIVVDGKYAYIATGKRGVSIIDITDPSSPKKISNVASMAYTYSLDIQGFNLFIADGKAGVRVIDIRDKGNPRQIGFISTGYLSLDIEVSGDNGYVAEGKGGIRIIDISKPSFPLEVTRYKDSLDVVSLDIVDGYAYLADKRGVFILDIRKPDSLNNPVRIGKIDSVENVISDGRWIFFSGKERGFVVSNIADLRYPITQSLYGYSDIKDIFLSGFYLYLAQGDFGIRILNILVPFSPMLVNQTRLPEEAIGIYQSSNLLYVVCGYDGLKIYRIRRD